MLTDGRACSVQAVHDELVASDDQLAAWARKHRFFFRDVDQHVARQFRPLTAWTASQNFTQAAVNDFTATAADFLLVAFAVAYDCTVVTNERPDPKSRRRVKIPDACKALGVAWTDPFTMFRDTGASLLLSATPPNQGCRRRRIDPVIPER